MSSLRADAVYPVFEVAAVRRAEARLMATLPPHTLMQRAAYGVACLVARELKTATGHVAGSIIVGLIGSGNNGSDTLLALSYLARRGVHIVAVDVTGQRKPDHTDAAFTAAHGQWLTLEDVQRRESEIHALLDGIAGIGCSRAIDESLCWFVRSFGLNKLVVAVDVPSGLDVDRAVPFDEDGYIHATMTAAIGCLKPCHVLDPAADACGDIRLIDIGLEEFESEPRLLLVGDDVVTAMFLGPTRYDHKYSRGVVGVIAGSQYPGAGLLAVRAARWGGAGMVCQVGAEFTEELATIVHHPKLTKKIDADAWVVGPGLGDAAHDVLEKLLERRVPLVIDADALNALAHDKGLRKALRKRDALAVLTPHGGEAKRLAAGYGVEHSDDVAQLARDLAAASNTVVYLKGSIGVVATPEGRVYASHRTTEHLATAGSGDVLAGFLGSLLASNEPFEADDAAHRVIAAVIVHSRAAELVALDGGPVIASEIEENLPAALADLISGL